MIDLNETTELKGTYKEVKNPTNSDDFHGEVIFEKSKTKTFEDLEKDVQCWAKDKGILVRENHLKQYIKFISEAGELGDAIIKNDKPEIIDAFGDVLITLIILSKQLDYDLIECLESAYKVIAKRTGETKNGVFIKN